ncbi:MAG: hypothetical protein OXC00_11915 [Acidimicrobiaceae bacterium]|nr:hypothetical protein [Acidimicrobiaceae bacterium]
MHLYVAGGAVIAAKTDSRLTGDVDVVSEGMTPQLRAAVEEVGKRHRGLRPDWLNDGAELNGPLISPATTLRWTQATALHCPRRRRRRTPPPWGDPAQAPGSR